ncbi:MAG TPA: lipoyl(octanoyl) transferase LipB [Chloroflexota bacterium]
MITTRPQPVCYDQRIMKVSSIPATLDLSPPSVPLRVVRLGLVPYEEALIEQRRLHAARAEDQIPDTLIVLEHPHVYTLGRNSDPAHILVDEDTLRARSATVTRIERGGEVTYHGPGQLVAYPIIKLGPSERSIAGLVWRLEETIIRTVATWGVVARRDPSDRGVWAGSGKIASIGMSLRRWVVLHGMALNVAPNMNYFDYINPCGHPGMRMTSLAQELECRVDVSAVADAFTTQFCAVFGRRISQENG